jgi:hypothetical protein
MYWFLGLEIPICALNKCVKFIKETALWLIHVKWYLCRVWGSHGSGFWVVTPYRSERAWCFGIISPPSSGSKNKTGNKNLSLRLLLVSCLPYSSTLKMEAICSSEMSAYLRTIRRYNPEYHNDQAVSKLSTRGLRTSSSHSRDSDAN